LFIPVLDAISEIESNDFITPSLQVCSLALEQEYVCFKSVWKKFTMFSYLQCYTKCVATTHFSPQFVLLHEKTSFFAW